MSLVPIYEIIDQNANSEDEDGTACIEDDNWRLWLLPSNF